MEQKISDKLKALPGNPGVYEMLDEKGKIIYVGKAINLKNRVSSYFKGMKDAKTTALVEKIRDINWTITGSEVEALILESNLIKENRPKYNIILRDDKHYPYLKINLENDWPKIQVVRRKVNDGAAYFGPYATIGSMKYVLGIIESLFPLRTCSDHELANRSRPCLQYQIKRCLGPCMGYVSREEYEALVRETILLLSGKEKELMKKLKVKMAQLSAELAFEKAAKVRDQIEVLGKLQASQIIDKGHARERDVIGLYEGESKSSIMVFFVRDGNLLNKESYFLEHQKQEDQGSILKAFIEQFYVSRQPGREIIIPLKLDEAEAASLEETLSALRGSRVRVLHPLKGEKKKLMELADSNAYEKYRQKEEVDSYRQQELERGLESLKSYLDLPKTPKRIECYDISNISGTNTVASMVVFTDGKADNKEYKKFRIRTVEGPNDFASMEEVLGRRFKMKDVPQPDLVIIDGGKGQLSSALKILSSYGLGDTPVFGLAKKEELLFREGSSQPIFIPRQDKALFILRELRDEAHRFAISYHRQLRGKEMTASIFDEIEGVGPTRKRELLKAFGSINGIRKASLDDIIGIVKNKKVAIKIKDVLGEE